MRQRHAANNGKKAEESRLAGMQRPMRGFIEDRERDGGHAHLNKLMAQSFGANVARVIGAVQPIVLQPSHALGIVTSHVDKASRDQTTRCAPQTRTQLVSSSISACLYITYAGALLQHSKAFICTIYT